MTDLNNLQIVGNLTRDAEVKYISNGMAVCKLSIAVNRSFKKDEQWHDEASFFDVEAWGKLAERLSGASKGQRVLIIGSIKQEHWEKDGVKQSKVKIVADRVEAMQRREKAQEMPSLASNKEMQNNAPVMPEPENFADDIPF